MMDLSLAVLLLSATATHCATAGHMKEWHVDHTDTPHPPLDANHVQDCPHHPLEFECVDGSHGPKDGMVDVSELTYREYLLAYQGLLDRNHDGRISAREALRYSQHKQKKTFHEKGEGPQQHHFQLLYDHGYDEGPGTAHAHRIAMNDIVRYDFNKDGALNKEEYQVLRNRDEWDRKDILESVQNTVRAGFHANVQGKEATDKAFSQGGENVINERMEFSGAGNFEL